MTDQEIKEKFNHNEHNHTNLMEKIDTLVSTVNDIKLSVAVLPQKILESADIRYASKASEVRLNALETRIESRSYDWLKQLAITLITIVLGFGIYNKIGN